MRVRMLHFTRQYKDTLQEIYDSDFVLLQLYYGICVSIIIPIYKDLIKLLQK